MQLLGLQSLCTEAFPKASSFPRVNRQHPWLWGFSAGSMLVLVAEKRGGDECPACSSPVSFVGAGGHSWTRASPGQCPAVPPTPVPGVVISHQAVISGGLLESIFQFFQLLSPLEFGNLWASLLRSEQLNFSCYFHL